MTDLISIIFLVILSGAAGRKCLRLIGFQSPSGDDNSPLLFSIGLGFGIISYSIYSLGILSLLYKWVLWAFLIVFVVFLRREIKDFCISISRLVAECIRGIPKLSRFNQGLLIFVAVYLAINLIGALTPLTDWDSQAYNLLAPKRFLLRHRIYFLPDNISQSNSHIGMEMLYILSLGLMGDGNLPQLLQYATGILAALTITIFCKKHLNSVNVGLLAGAVFYSIPDVSALSVSAKIDLGLTFYFLLMVFSFFIWAYDTERDDKWLLLSSIFLGLAATVKLTGIFFFPPFFAAALLAGRFHKRLDWGRAIFKSFKYGSIGFLIVLPWCIKSYYFFGDPFYPLLLHGGGDYVLAPVKMSFIGFLSLPWNMVFHVEKVTEPGSMSASVVFLGFLPFLFLITRKDKKTLFLLGYSLIWIAQFYAAGGITARWILPSFALLSIVYAFSIIRFFEDSRRHLKVIVMALLFCYFAVSPSFASVIRWAVSPGFASDIRWSVVLGLESKDDYLSRSLDFYDTFQYANKNLPTEAKIFDPWEVRGYYLDREFFSGNSLPKINFTKNCHAALEKLRGLGVTHVMKNYNYHNLLLSMYADKLTGFDPSGNIFYKPCMDKYLERIYDSKNVYLYAIKSPLPADG